jgi:pyruvate formate lyase activating enzyme
MAGSEATTETNALSTTIDQLTQPAGLVEQLEDNRVRCLACGHRCQIPESRRGICEVRHNREGTLQVPYGYVSGLHNDPIEKKPFYHFLPGTNALTFGMLGCSLHCPYCQNWLTSQALRDQQAGVPPDEITAEEIVDTACRAYSKAVVSSYNEPLITIEWAVDIFKLAKQEGLKTACVSNGHATPEALKYLRPVTDGFKVDLKSINDHTYRKLGGILQHVQDSIQQAWDMDFWVEVVTLVVPGLNDSEDELRAMANFIAGISPDIPWHVSAFHRDYKYTEALNTPTEALIRAWDLGRQAGLHYVYGGNLPGMVPDLENTICPGCDATLIRRVGYYVLDNQLTGDGKCPDCDKPIPGIWAG